MATYLKRKITEEDLANIREQLKIRVWKLRREPSCDFCGSVDPAFMYAANVMSTGAVVQNWRWCACGTCSELVDRRDWFAIESRIVRWMAENFPAILPGGEHTLQTLAQRALHDFHMNAVLVKSHEG